ncbi:hypothetical protein [Lentibacillus sp. CBA3610]|uniref:hypothetical protein n=1 Tax=Lentibacillus sp. CBA3610 TaxID=2518176 RepID=UPI00350E5884
MLKRMRFLGLTAIMILLVVLAACGGSGNDESSESNGDDGASNEEASNESSNGDTVSEIGQEELTIPYVAWASATASNHVMEVVLEEAGYDVTLQQVQCIQVYPMVQRMQLFVYGCRIRMPAIGKNIKKIWCI